MVSRNWAEGATFECLHIDYKAVLFNVGRRGSNASSDLLSPKGGADADTKKRSSAAGLFKRQNQPSSGASKGKARG